MKVLAIETATAVCAAALLDGAEVRGERVREEAHAHAESIVGFIEDILTATRTPLREIDGIAVSIGPGSFTGLRIGLSVAKGLAYASEKPLTAVSTLEALARSPAAGDAGDALILSLIDARRDEVYVAGYRTRANSAVCAIPPQAQNLPALYDLLEDERKIILVGDGTEKFNDYLLTMEGAGRFVIPPREGRACSAVAVGRVGMEQFARGETSDVSRLEPVYVKEFHTTMKPSPGVAR